MILLLQSFIILYASYLGIQEHVRSLVLRRNASDFIWNDSIASLLAFTLRHNSVIEGLIVEVRHVIKSRLVNSCRTFINIAHCVDVVFFRSNTANNITDFSGTLALKPKICCTRFRIPIDDILSTISS